MFVYLKGWGGVVFAVITQIRINVMNLYSGSLALSNGFTSRHTGVPAGNGGCSSSGCSASSSTPRTSSTTRHLLAIAGVLTNTWLLIILADYFVCRRWLRLGRMEGIEFREEEVRAWNPCGLISLGVAVAVGALGIIGVPYLLRLVSGHDHRSATPRCHHRRYQGSLL